MSLPPPDGRPALPLYLGPSLPRWQPLTVQDVENAIDDGTLKERHWLDVKAELGRTDPGRKGVAKDLASFANDGGGLLIGVREDKAAGTINVDPVPLDGLAEAVDQIARSRCDPPLYVACHPLYAPRGEGESATGVLLVEIPPSPNAPHMVDGRYWGRNDTTNHQLTDGDVAQLHARRSARQVTAAALIAEEDGRDPVPAEHREFSHLHVVAQPIASPPDLLTPLMGTPALSDLVHSVAARVPTARQVDPGWHYLQMSEPRARGWGFCSFYMSGRRFRPELQDAKEGGLFDVEVDDDGRVSLFSGRASDRSYEEQLVVDRGIAALTRAVVSLAGMLGERAGYAGAWVLAVGVTDLAAKRTSEAVIDRLRVRYPEFSADAYVQGTEAVTVELLDRPGAVTGRLVARLLRALGASSAGLFAD